MITTYNDFLNESNKNQYILLLRLDYFYYEIRDNGTSDEENSYYNDPIYYNLLFNDKSYIECTLFREKEILMVNSHNTTHGQAAEWWNIVKDNKQLRTSEYIKTNAIDVLDYRFENEKDYKDILKSYINTNEFRIEILQGAIDIYVDMNNISHLDKETVERKEKVKPLLNYIYNNEDKITDMIFNQGFSSSDLFNKFKELGVV